MTEKVKYVDASPSRCGGRLLPNERAQDKAPSAARRAALL
jgi:hypothetical protein